MVKVDYEYNQQRTGVCRCVSVTDNKSLTFDSLFEEKSLDAQRAFYLGFSVPFNNLDDVVYSFLHSHAGWRSSADFKA